MTSRGQVPMEFERFKQEYVAAREELSAGSIPDVAGVQAQLREMAATLSDETDLRVAEGLIEQLTAATPTDSGQSPEMAEALRVLDTADFDTGTKEQRLAALTAARQQIWAIADRAGRDSGAIRGLTRGLEKSEELLTEGPPWADEETAGA
ncbi:hypothetical protein ACGFIF_22625 [Kribbella sp. NPDC049174]|uniref:hypothetical protein n=1 Tax=Kribbella sp. NPDC049174 TaxID=3364112 RepID=UPI003723B37D